MLTVHFLDSDQYAFSPEDRRRIEDIAVLAEQRLRVLLPLVEHLHLLVEPSEVVLPTGDNASTLAPHLIRWMANPALGVADVARRHLAPAPAHEAFHAARFRQLPPEVDGGCWENVAIAEGLATAFARDNFAADEPWSAYPADLIESWAAELYSQPLDDQSVREWKFSHPDGRTFVAFRVGTWLVDVASTHAGLSPGDLVWVPAQEILSLTKV
jgi:Predicted Zn-dependent protease (DUF2268)